MWHLNLHLQPKNIRSYKAILKGLHHSAQSWRVSAYPGGCVSNRIINSERVESKFDKQSGGSDSTLSGLTGIVRQLTQGSLAGSATLG